MSLFSLLLFLSLLLLTLSPLSSSSNTSRRLLQSTTTTTSASCPLNFTALQQLLIVSNTETPNLVDTATRCQYIKQGLRLVESLYLKSTNNFLPPLSSASSCWSSYQNLANSFVSNFDIRNSCGFQTNWISQGCMNITTRQLDLTRCRLRTTRYPAERIIDGGVRMVVVITAHKPYEARMRGRKRNGSYHQQIKMDGQL